MVLIVKKGTVPPTPHTEFYAIPKVLTKEEIHGSYGFSGAWSRKIHVRFYPTEQVKPPKKSDFALVPDFPPEADVLQPYHIFTGRMPHEGDAIRGRKPIVHGTRTTLSISKPSQSMPKETFFRNGERHEVYFVQDAEGVVPPRRVNASDQLRPALLQQGGPGHPHVTGRRDRDRDAGPASVPRRAWRVPDRRETRRGKDHSDHARPPSVRPRRLGGGPLSVRLRREEPPRDRAGDPHGAPDAPDVPIGERPAQRLLPLFLRPRDGGMASPRGPGPLRPFQRGLRRADVLLQPVLRGPRGRRRGRILHVPSRLDAAQPAGQRGPAVPRGSGEGPGAARGHARHVLREHAHHDARVRAPRPAI